MKYLADISQKQAKKIQKLIESDQYDSVAQFISVAVENQLYLEDSETKSISNDELIFDDLNVEKNSELTKFNLIKLSNIQSKPRTVYEPTFGQLVLSNEIKKEENTWLWGQINRVLPIKIGVRVLFRELDNRQWIDLDQFVEEATKEAARVGQLLRAYEDKNHKKRDEKISAGLPNVSDEKSQIRYKSHFLTYCRKDRLLNGAMAIMRFANIQQNGGKGKHCIGLTKPGFEFAVLNNPALDMRNFEQSIDEQEAIFYLAHTKKYVISEHSAIMWILRKIDAGINERDALNKELKKDYGEIWEASDAVINTQRAGLMARMHELGLLNKKKNGIYVKYQLSEFGKSYLTKINVL